MTLEFTVGKKIYQKNVKKRFNEELSIDNVAKFYDKALHNFLNK